MNPNGTFAEYMALAPTSLVKLPPHDPAERLLMAQQLGTVLFSLKRYWRDGDLRTPTLVVWGRDEPSVPPMADVRQRAALIPSARFELVPGGHEPWLDDLDSTARQVASVHLAGHA